jgi:hypothetical protein
MINKYGLEKANEIMRDNGKKILGIKRSEETKRKISEGRLKRGLAK